MLIKYDMIGICLYQSYAKYDKLRIFSYAKYDMLRICSYAKYGMLRICSYTKYGMLRICSNAMKLRVRDHKIESVSN